MRINLYAEELTDEVEVVKKAVTDEEFGDRLFYGIRLYLKSPEELHHGAEDDDRSAVTFWVKWTAREGTDPTLLESALNSMLDALAKEVVGS